MKSVIQEEIERVVDLNKPHLREFTNEGDVRTIILWTGQGSRSDKFTGTVVFTTNSKRFVGEVAKDWDLYTCPVYVGVLKLEMEN